GSYTNELNNRQAEKAEADDFVVYYNEWVDGQATLGQYGTEHLSRMIARLPGVPFPVVLQPEPGFPRLTAVRRHSLSSALASAGINDAAVRVVVGRPEAEGLFGEEAERIYPQLI